MAWPEEILLERLHRKDTLDCDCPICATKKFVGGQMSKHGIEPLRTGPFAGQIVMHLTKMVLEAAPDNIRRDLIADWMEQLEDAAKELGVRERRPKN